ncbi:MAG: hypothetical protein NC489_08125 [Ruminococcus flavefaciens]|nr:hypothetical protein [Ruminococcus flavefaciens]
MHVSADSGHTWYKPKERNVISRVRKELIGVTFLDVGDVCEVIMDLNNDSGTIVIRSPRGCNMMLLGNEYRNITSADSPTVVAGMTIESAISKTTESGVPYLRIGDKMVVSKVLSDTALLAKHPNHPMDIYLETGDYTVPSSESGPDQINPVSHMLEDMILRSKIKSLYDLVFEGDLIDTRLRISNPVTVVGHMEGSLIMEADPATHTITIKRV